MYKRQGNLVRIENALDKMPERLRSVQEQLENLYNQKAAAKAEVGKPFPQEQQLAAKTARLIELDMAVSYTHLDVYKRQTHR